jgi:hypothetical protein
VSKPLAIFYVMGGYVLAGCFGILAVQTAFDADAFRSTHSGNQTYVRVSQ